MINWFARNATKLAICEMGNTAFSPRIGTMKLGPSFLQKTYPYLAIFARCEGCSIVFIDRKEIVNDHRCFDSVNVKINKVATSRISFLGEEQLFDAIRLFCQIG